MLDACVLVPRLLCDLLLRLAEEPRLFVPKWSDVVLQEVERNQVRLGLSVERARSWQTAVAEAFPEARIDGYDALLPECENDPKARHVLAAAISVSAPVIATFNLRDFPANALEPWGIVALQPGSFLMGLYERAPEIVALKLLEMTRHGRSQSDVLVRLRRVVPTFAALVAHDLGVEID